MAVAVLDDGSVRAKVVSQDLGLSLTKSPSEYFLSFEAGQWVVRDPRQGSQFCIRIDLAKQWQDLKRQKFSVKKDALCRAVGFKGQADFKVIDGTLGFAKDAVHMSVCGIGVIGFEQNPLTFWLVQSALMNSNNCFPNFCLFRLETSAGLARLGGPVDAVYLDPMFENTKAKSAPKKSLAFLREVSSAQTDVPGIVEQSLKLGVKRVVVKRPINGQQLYNKPNIVIEGKLIRYDVYTRSSI